MIFLVMVQILGKDTLSCGERAAQGGEDLLDILSGENEYSEREVSLGNLEVGGNNAG